jgi:hypothetical protein
VLATLITIVIAMVLAPGAGGDKTLPPPVQDTRQPPPVVVGHQLPPILHLGDVNYDYAQSFESRAGAAHLRLVVPARGHTQAVTWVTPWTLKGKIVVRVDGEVVNRSGPGPLGEGVLLTPGRDHSVVLQATHPLPGARLGLAVYRWPNA